MKRPTIEKIHAVMHEQGMKVFTTPYDCTLGWIRTKDNKANTFNDWQFMSYFLPNGGIVSIIAPSTTDAGLYYRLNPMNVDGTAIIQHGKQYRGAFRYMKTGGHRGGEGFRQIDKIWYWRDNDRNEYLNFDGKEQFELFHTNGHNMFGITVGKDSAGCWGTWKEMMRLFYDMAQVQIDHGFGDKFSLAALHENMF
jgi:hypothetical protein